jgi:hypothetical protein
LRNTRSVSSSAPAVGVAGAAGRLRRADDDLRANGDGEGGALAPAEERGEAEPARALPVARLPLREREKKERTLPMELELAVAGWFLDARGREGKELMSLVSDSMDLEEVHCWLVDEARDGEGRTGGARHL